MINHALVYESRLNGVIDYIQAHLNEPLSLEQLAEVAQFSPFHFHRIFKGFSGEAPAAMVRRLRVENSIKLLERASRPTISEIALDCGFSSPSDFSRAFKESYGYSPSLHRTGKVAKESKICQEVLRNSSDSYVGMHAVDPADQFRVDILELPETEIAYVRVVGMGKPEKMMSALRRLMDWGTSRGIWPGQRLAAISPDHPDVTPASKYRLDLCMVLPPRFKKDSALSYGVIPGGKYASIHCLGDISKVERAWNHLYLKWLPDSGYEAGNSPALELFRSTKEPEDWSLMDLDCCLPIYQRK